ncbi:MAG: hypothetical protein HQL35_01845 [Alphaproteobacteria bacterium]|nr:hypothetical protein [Alphaproteobacteria bacterium]
MKVLQNLLLVALSILGGVIVIEGVLYIADPFEIRVSADKITLPVGRVYEFRNATASPNMDADIVHRKNRLGFRGEDWPRQPERREKWIFVGGSTTESFYFNQDDTWVDQVFRHQKTRHPHLWVNNAGLDGHSSFGHVVLTEGFLIDLKPQKIFYLVGINDVGYDAPNSYDGRLETGEAEDWFRRSTQIGKLITVIKRASKAKSFGLTHDFTGDWANALAHSGRVELSSREREAVLTSHRDVYLPSYRQRVETLIDMTLKNGIEPVLITQPALFGPATDPATGHDLGRVQQALGLDGTTRWQVLEEYNDAVRSLAKQRNVAVIDLARTMPKDTRLYYDWIHYNKAGQAEVAKIVNEALDALYQSPLP